MRHRLRATLDRPFTPDADPGARPVRADDAPVLAALMLAAYRGTIDDGGEGPDEARAEADKLLSGGYGEFDFAASEVIERDGRIVAATLVTTYQGVAMIAFSMTDPAHQRRGLARAGLIRALHRLRQAGHASVDLAVTAGNTPAERLYASLGFVPVTAASG